MGTQTRSKPKLAQLPFRFWNPEVLERLLVPAIVAAVLFFAYFWGARVSDSLVIMLFLVVGALVAFMVLSRNPMVGLAGLILVSFFGRWTLGTGSRVSVNFTILLAAFMIGLWVLRMFLLDREVRLSPSRVNKPALLFAAATTLSLFAGNVSWILNAPAGAEIGAQLGAWTLYVLPVGILLLVGNEVKDVRWLKRLTWLFILAGGLYLATRIVPGLAFIRLNYMVPNKGFGSMFWVWFTALTFGQFLFNKDLPLHWRLGAGLLTAAALGSSIIQSSGWISGWGLSLLTVGILVWLYSRRLGLVLTLAVLVVLVFAYVRVQSQVFNPIEQYSISSRFATYPIMFELIKANPILGLGPANYYHFTPLYSILGWNVQFNSHNNYMDILAQTGIVGLGIFIWLAYELGRLSWRMREKVRDGFSLGFTHAAVAGFLVMLVSGLFGDWFLPFIYNISTDGFRASAYAWFFLGGLLALEQINRKEGEVVNGSNH